MTKNALTVFGWFVIFILLPANVLAQEGMNTITCEVDVIVQADDWLSKIADKYFGNTLAYPIIVDATNSKAILDNTYTKIEDPDIIEPGWKLCIPHTEDALSISETAETLVVSTPRLIDYNGLQFVWEWEGEDKILSEDWYFDIKIYHSANALEPYETLVADPNDPQKAQYFNGKWYSDLPMNFQGCSHWAVQIAKRDISGEFEKHISPESERRQVGPCESSTFSSPIR